MKSQREIFVDFNNRILPKAGEFFKVSLNEIADLELLDQVRATDYDELEFDVLIVARRNDLGYGVVELVRTDVSKQDSKPDIEQPGYGTCDVSLEAAGTDIGPQELLPV